MTWSGRKLVRLVLVMAGLSALVISMFPFGNASASQITSRSLTLQAGATDGGSKPSGVVNHLFSFTIPSSSSMGSIQLEYCTTAGGTCLLPTGLSTTGGGVTLGTQTGAATGFTLNNTTNGAPYLTRSPSTVTPGNATYQLLGVTNPSAANTTFYVRITTFSLAALGGSTIDTGTVAASTASQIVLTGTMPESLIFCTGATIGTTGGVPDCTTATSGVISFNQLFSPSDTATATSQMSASTNAASGYNITVNGPTLTSGGNTVTAMASSTPGVRGTSQFGLNLAVNTTTTSTPAVGVALTPAANGTNYKGEALTGYATPDSFKYVSGAGIADSAFSGAGPTDSQIYTTSYIVNVNGAQAFGTYTTTLTYICTATY